MATVIICTRNRPEQLVKLLRSLLAQELCDIKNVIVIDSSADTSSALVIEDIQTGWKQNLHYFQVPTTYSLPQKRNIGLIVSQNWIAETISFFDDDVVLSPDYMKKVTTALNENTAIGATGLDLARSDNGVPIWKQVLGIDSRKQGVILSSGVNTGIRDSKQSLELEWVSGCAMTFRSSSIRGMYFDERRCFDGEDSDFTFRVSQRGKLISVPKATYTHNTGFQVFSNRNHKVRYHLQHLALATLEFKGKVKFPRVLVFLLSNGLLLCLIGIRESSFRGITYGLRYICGSVLFPLILLRQAPQFLQKSKRFPWGKK